MQTGSIIYQSPNIQYTSLYSYNIRISGTIGIAREIKDAKEESTTKKDKIIHVLKQHESILTHVVE